MSEKVDIIPQEEEKVVEVITPKRRIFPTFIDLAAILGVLCIAQVVGTVVAMTIFSINGADSVSASAQGWTLAIAYIFSMSMTILFALLLRRKRKAENTSQIKISLKGFDPLIILGGFIMLMACSIVVEPLIEIIPVISQQKLPNHWSVMLMVVVCAPLFEEILCRGILFESLRSKRGIIPAWLISSLFFGVMHLEPSTIVAAFFSGLILCYFYIASRSIIAPIILHALNNAVAYIFIIIGWGDITLREVISNDGIYHLVYAVAILVLVLSILICQRRFRSIIKSAEQAPQPLDEEPKEL